MSKKKKLHPELKAYIDSTIKFNKELEAKIPLIYGTGGEIPMNSDHFKELWNEEIKKPGIKIVDSSDT